METNRPTEVKPLLRPNARWWLIAILLLIPVGLVLLNRSRSAIEISQRRFEDMLTVGDVREVTVVSNRNTVEVSLTENALGKEPYRGELNRNGAVLNRTHYRFKIIGSEFFERDFKETQRNLAAASRVAYRTEYRSTLGGFGLTWGVVWVLTGVLVTLWGVALLDITRRRFSQSYERFAWLATLFLSPMLGLILYLLFGTRQKAG